MNNSFHNCLKYCLSYNQKQNIVNNKVCATFDENKTNSLPKYCLEIQQVPNMGVQPENSITSPPKLSYSGYKNEKELC